MEEANSPHLITQISQVFQDKQKLEALLEKERIARRTAEQEKEDAEEGQSRAEDMRSAAEAQCRQMEEMKAILEEQLEEERQRRQQSEKGVERLLTGLKDELLDPEDSSRIEGDLRAQISSLQDAARQMRREVQHEKVQKGKVEGTIQDLQADLAKGERDRAVLESEIEDMKGRLKKMAELRAQIDAAKDQARKEVDEARRRAREQVEEERANRAKAEAMYQDVLQEVSKYDHERREADHLTAGLQKELDAERQKSHRLEEEKGILESGRKDRDRVVAQAEATLESTAKELEDYKKDCFRLRNMLEDEKKQRDIAEEAWKEYSKCLHKERTAYNESLGRLPDDDDIMQTVHDNLSGLERASSDEGDPFEYNMRSPFYQPQYRHTPPPQNAPVPAPMQTRRMGSRRGRGRPKPSAPQSAGLGRVSPVQHDPEGFRSMGFQPPTPDPNMIQDQQMPQQQGMQPGTGFGPAGFVQVPGQGGNTLNRPYAEMGNANDEESGLFVNQPNPAGGNLYHPVIVPARDLQVQRPRHRRRFGWVHHFNPFRIRLNPFGWIWVRRGGIAHNIVRCTETIGRTTGKLARSFWAWVVVLVVFAGSVGFKEDEETGSSSGQNSRYNSQDRGPVIGDQEEPRIPPPPQIVDVQEAFKARSFVG